MKNLLLLIGSVLILSNSVQSQSFISITPNTGIRGQNIQTTVTAAGFFFTQGSAPSPWGDFYMSKGSTTITPYAVNILDDDHLTANWSIPSNAPVGNYSVTWNQFGWNPLNIPGGFNIGDAFISGKVFFDADSSGTMNGIENPMYNQKILLLPDSSYSFTDAAGNYAIGTANGPKNVQIEPALIWNITTPNPVPLTVASANITGIDFGLKGITDYYNIDAALTGSGTPRCNRNVPYFLTYTNTGTVQTHGEVIFIRSLSCSFISSNIPPDNINGNVYTWNYIDLNPGETRNIIVTLHLPGPAFIQNGMQVIARDDNNNIVKVDEALLSQTVVCAMDPNDKTVIPEGVQIPHYTLLTDTLDFIVRFQNTGNDTAFNVVILDTLNKNILDVNSFEIISSSHPVVIDLKPNGIAKFYFDNILLPDSNVNEEESHGFIRYRCRILSGVPSNTVLNNTAYIYFDFNAAVITNTSLNTLVTTLPVGLVEHSNEYQVSIMPNPVIEDATLSFTNSSNEKLTIKVYDVRGKLVSQQETTGQKITIPAKLLHTGVYIYELKNSSGTKINIGKFIVM